MAQPAKIKVRTARFGLIEVPENSLIYVSQGIIGFPKSSRYVILEHAENCPIKWLQSLDEPKVAFAIADPLIFFPDYFLQVKKEDLAGLEVENIEDLVIYILLSLHCECADMSANLQGPLIINTKNRRARQIVLKDGRYTTRHFLFPKLREAKISNPKNA